MKIKQFFKYLFSFLLDTITIKNNVEIFRVDPSYYLLESLPQEVSDKFDVTRPHSGPN